ncbi:MAG: hypothetical protein Q4D62_09265 [Planctomycetia bacterium]|nr:hypothetical protein [Planctomycetia bacterium]
MKKKMWNVLCMGMLWAGCAAVLNAEEKVWNGNDGNWGTAENWNPAGVPTVTDHAKINAGTVKFQYGDGLRADTLEISGTGSLIYWDESGGGAKYGILSM